MMLVGILIGGASGWFAGKIIFALLGPIMYQHDDPEYREAIATNFPFGLAAIGALIGGLMALL